MNNNQSLKLRMVIKAPKRENIEWDATSMDKNTWDIKSTDQF
jgi:hypothetical protein